MQVNICSVFVTVKRTIIRLSLRTETKASGLHEIMGTDSAHQVPLNDVTFGAMTRCFSLGGLFSFIGRLAL